MSYYQDVLKTFAVAESAVDCDRCVSQYKCCTYRPFIANFLAGQIFDEHQIENEVFGEWDLLVAGLSPAMSYRKLFLKKGKWGFGSEKSLLCNFYDLKSGRCRMWSARPSVCKTFFCKSSYGDAGMTYWQKTEEFSWRLEWLLLEDFLFEQGFTLDDVAVIKRYLSEDYLRQPFSLPKDLIFEDLEKAREFYLKAHRYIAGKSPEDIRSLWSERGDREHADLVALQSKIL